MRHPFCKLPHPVYKAVISVCKGHREGIIYPGGNSDSLCKVLLGTTTNAGNVDQALEPNRPRNAAICTVFPSPISSARITEVRLYHLFINQSRPSICQAQKSQLARVYRTSKFDLLGNPSVSEAKC
jgi:hypothetical protein